MVRRYGLVAGPLLAVLLYLWIPETLQDPGGGPLRLGAAGRMTGALASWMAIWWMTGRNRRKRNWGCAWSAVGKTSGRATGACCGVRRSPDDLHDGANQ